LAGLIRRFRNDPAWVSDWADDGVALEYRGAEAFTRMVKQGAEEFSFHLREIGLL
jgi:hypothetical protein